MEEINGKVSISGDYFLKMAKADYRNYKEALWREIYQNSIDAGATTISVTRDGNSFTIIDDGCGIDQDTLVNKLLTLGGSKKAEGSVGAFGKAKELELFSWEKYKLHTHNLLLEGSGDDYTITEVNEYFDGTKITIWIQEDESPASIYRYTTTVAQKMETNCAIFIDGIEIKGEFPRGEFRKAFPFGNVYVNENLPATYYYAKVRINGIWMFDWYIGSDAPHITLELSANSIACLTSNRDGLKNEYLEEVQKFFRKLAADRRSALFPDKEEVLLHVDGEEGKQFHISEEDMEFIENRFSSKTREEFLAAFAKFITLEVDIDQILLKMRTKDVDRYDHTRMRYFGFKWDTVHKFEKGKEKQAGEFLDGSKANAKRAKTLLTMWGETIKQVLLDTRNYTPFTVGFNWDENQQAQLSSDEGRKHFYLNPSILDTYPLTNKRGLARKLRLLATHEVAHINNDYHDEYFMQRMEEIMEKSWKSDKLYDRISKITA